MDSRFEVRVLGDRSIVSTTVRLVFVRLGIRPPLSQLLIEVEISEVPIDGIEKFIRAVAGSIEMLGHVQQNVIVELPEDHSLENSITLHIVSIRKLGEDCSDSVQQDRLVMRLVTLSLDVFELLVYGQSECSGLEVLGTKRGHGSLVVAT